MNNNSLMFRFDNELMERMKKIKKNYNFRSNSELAKYMVLFMCRIIAENDNNDLSIEEIFENFMYDEGETFEYCKSKRSMNKSQCLSLDEFSNITE